MHKERTPKEVLAWARSEGVKLVDLKFVDFVGQWQHKTHPLHEFDEGTFENGLGFDGSSIRGWKAIDNSDMLQIPDARTAFIDPFCDQPTLSLICNVVDPITREAYSRDPRQIAQKAANYVKLTGNEAKQMLKLYEAVDDHDDVQHVWANFDIEEKEIEALA